MLKRSLSVLSALGLTTMTTATVVSCGPMTFGKLMNRAVDTSVYKTYYAAPMSSWSTGVTMQNEDLKILANLQETLLKANVNKEVEGNLATEFDGSDADKTWTLTLKNDAHWFDYKGNVAEQKWIKASDVANTLRYIYNPSTTSQINGLWGVVMSRADELSNAITTATGADYQYENEASQNFALDEIIKHYIQITKNGSTVDMPGFWTEGKAGTSEALPSISDKTATYPDSPMLTVEDGVNDEGEVAGGTVIFHLASTAPYFPTMLTYLAFSPLPDIAVDYRKSTAGYSYGNAANNSRGYDHVYYSGAYVPRDVNISVGMKLVANKNYFDYDQTSIKEIIYNYPKNQSPSNLVFLFETGDLSETPISPTDARSWSKYVGSDLTNPKFKGLKDVYAGTPATWMITYNFGYRPEGTSSGADISGLDENKLLAQNSTRALISYAINRSTAAHYYSSALDPQGAVKSSLLRNIYTANGLALDVNEKDYTDYIKTSYGAKVQDVATQMGQTLTDDELAEQEALTDNGQDLYLQNDYLAYSALTDESLKQEFINDQSVEAKIQTLIKQVNLDRDANEIKNNVKFRFLENGALKTTFLPWLNSMIDEFDQIPNLPFSITYNDSQSIDQADFAQKQRQSAYSMNITGWSPDYADPSTYLNTIRYKGDYDAYNNFSKVIDSTTSDGQETLKGKNSSYDDLATKLSAYGKLLDEASQQADTISRYQQFSQAEMSALYETQVILPLYTRTPETLPTLTYLDHSTVPSVAYGTSNYRFTGVKMIKKLSDGVVETQSWQEQLVNKLININFKEKVTDS
ncbi:hypothetical protein LD119_00239 [Mesoplasma sp. JKS002660]|uniref:ABC transporter substrate-binding protein n=1 Tax=Mesoplasma whartonense TaxID=2878854 RepID=UPI002022B05B|nr:ABC transporter substrate-binding protein [Mesoplasma sp. JKS002660]MCL8213312.1 hypothetical protein [Mesoplasma sp. JKS002660]